MQFINRFHKFKLGNKIKNYLPLIIISILPLFFELNCTNPTSPPQTKEEPPKAVKLNLLDVSCTEAFIKVTASDTVLPVSITLNKDESALLNFTLTKTDTVVIDTTLEPGKTYTYQTVAQIKGTTEKSDTLQVKSLNITSNNFTWQTYTFGGKELSDVAIIDENNIWAVGEINVSDSSGNGYTTYNAVHWDGSKWELKRILYKGVIWPISTVYAFNDKDIWFSAFVRYDGENFKELPIPNVLMGWHINKIWGQSSNNIYAVGNSGNIAHYQNGKWSKVESGTTTNINDIWGINDSASNTSFVLCAVSNQAERGDYKLLSISNNTATEYFNWPYTGIYSIWFNSPLEIYIVGGDAYRYNSENLSKINLPTNYSATRVRGTGLNDIYVCTSGGHVSHYNGIIWQKMSSGINGIYEGMDVKGNTIALVGFNIGGSMAGAVVTIVKRY